MQFKKILATVALTGALVIAPTASVAKSAGTTGVVGPCGTLTTLTATNVTLTNGFASPLTVKGSISNCSIYLQSYFVRFSEPARPVSSGLNGGTATTCTADFTVFNINYVSSGAKVSFTGTTNITPTAVLAPATCKGVHTLLAELRSRTDSRLLGTTTATYTVS